jgi:hypothetical protein
MNHPDEQLMYIQRDINCLLDEVGQSRINDRTEILDGMDLPNSMTFSKIAIQPK